MATASSFEAYTQSDTLQALDQTGMPPPLPPAAPMLVPGVGTGYRDIAKSRSSHSSPLAALLIACIGIAGGVLAGTWLATGHLNFKALFHPQPQVAAPLESTPVKAAPPVTHLKKPELSSQALAAGVAGAQSAAAPAQSSADPAAPAEAKPATGAPISALPKAAPLAKKRSILPAAQHARSHAQLPARRLTRTAARRKTLLHQAAMQTAAPILLDQPITRIEAPAPVLSLMEGDVTVADYDELTGLIETREGKTFILGSSYDAPNAVPWQEFRSNLHYRCDRNGHCSLARSGSVSPDARLNL